MKHLVKGFFGNFGLEISKKNSSPYEHLKKLPRYQETMVQLLGKDFKLADPHSFYWSHAEIFLQEIYKFNASTSHPYIIDCGSNYGTSVVYFKTLYPEASIMAIEADPYIYEILEWNVQTRNYKGISLINKAVSNSTEPIHFYKEGADGGRIHPIENQIAEKIQIETILLDELIDRPVDFLKMDIEGAESEVICASQNLNQVNQLLIEYHSFQNTPQTLSDLLTKLNKEGFRYYIHTEFCSPRPLTEDINQLGMDLQLNIFGKK